MTAQASTYHVHNLGCKVNRAESDGFAARFEALGYKAAPLEEAAFVVVNTCTVTSEADAKTRKCVRGIVRKNPGAKVIVTGCSVYLNRDFFEQLSGSVIPEPDKSKVAGLIDQLAGSSSAANGGTALTHHCGDAGLQRFGEGFRTRSDIKVQDGCDNSCAYCIVHKARGPLWSRPVSETLDELRAAEACGLMEVVLTGINLGKYDFEGTGLVGLLEALLEGTSKLRLRLSSIEPPDVTPALISLMARSQGRIAPHLHLPLQSGYTHTLREMGRLYTADEYAACAAALRESLPDISLSTDIIVGFPGETDDDFEESLRFCESMAFSKMHVFRYSKRPGTAAAKRPDQIASDTIAKRAERMRKLGDDMRMSAAETRIGSSECVLVQDEHLAMSGSYFECKPEADATFSVPRGTLADALICGRDGDTLVIRCK